MNELNLSIVVICCNEEEFIEECLGSIASQDYNSSLYEVLIIENGSTDKTQEVVKSFIKDYPNMNLIVSDVCGIAANRNIGISEAKYKYVAFIDADCTAEIGWLSSLVNGFQEESKKNSRIAAIGGPNILPKKANFFRRLFQYLFQTIGAIQVLQGAIFKSTRIIVEHIPTLNVLYDKEKVLEIGGLMKTMEIQRRFRP